MSQLELHTSLQPSEFIERLKTIHHSSFGHTFKEELKFRFSGSVTNLLFNSDGFELTRKGMWFGTAYRNVICRLVKDERGSKLLFTSKLNKLQRLTNKLILIGGVIGVVTIAIFEMIRRGRFDLRDAAFLIPLLLIFIPIVWIVTAMTSNHQKKEVIFMLEDLIKEMEKEIPTN